MAVVGHSLLPYSTTNAEDISNLAFMRIFTSGYSGAEVQDPFA
jgi:hypothetical protein